MARKARMMVAKMRRLRKTNVRPYREKSEITPLLTTFKETNGTSTTTNGSTQLNGSNGHAHKANGTHTSNGTTSLQITNHLYPIEEDDIGSLAFIYNLIEER